MRMMNVSLPSLEESVIRSEHARYYVYTGSTGVYFSRRKKVSSQENKRMMQVGDPLGKLPTALLL